MPVHRRTNQRLCTRRFSFPLRSGLLWPPPQREENNVGEKSGGEEVGATEVVINTCLRRSASPWPRGSAVSRSHRQVYTSEELAKAVVHAQTMRHAQTCFSHITMQCQRSAFTVSRAATKTIHKKAPLL